MNNSRNPWILTIAILISLQWITSSVWSNQYIVANTNDTGPGSLRQALLDADATAGSDTIVFNIPIGVTGHDAGAGIWTIQPLTPMPNMEDDSTFVDGNSQAVFIGGDPNTSGPEIVLDGTNTENAYGLDFVGSHNTVTALVVHRFAIQLFFIGTQFFPDSSLRILPLSLRCK